MPQKSPYTTAARFFLFQYGSVYSRTALNEIWCFYINHNVNDSTKFGEKKLSTNKKQDYISPGATAPD